MMMPAPFNFHLLPSLKESDFCKIPQRDRIRIFSWARLTVRLVGVVPQFLWQP
jgi:hypothetical protein